LQSRLPVLFLAFVVLSHATFAHSAIPAKGVLVLYSFSGQSVSDPLDSLSGQRPEDIPVVHNSGVRVRVDWRQLQRWISQAALPPGSQVLFRQPTVWQRYEKLILGGITLVVLQAILIIMLLWQRSKKQESEANLRESEERFCLVGNAAPVLIWMSGPDKMCTYFNKPWLEFTGRTLEEELGNGWAERVHPEDFHSCLATYTNSFDQRQSFKMQYRLQRHDGEYRWLFDIGVPRFKPDKSFAGYIGSCTDVTEQRLAQEALGRLGGKLLDAQERERSRIARELHDDICQRLAILGLEIEHAMRDSGLTTAQADRMREVWRHCSEITGDVQALSHELHSSLLDHLGLIAATKTLCKEFAQQQGVVVEFVPTDMPPSWPRDVSLCLFRVEQEALHNAAKHSGATLFEVRMRGANGGIELEVRDGGVGFDIKNVRDDGGLGLISMQERVHLVKGTLAIDSQTNRGTTIRATVPLVTPAGATLRFPEGSWRKGA
jgi:PAS domain S-box-containing protein